MGNELEEKPDRYKIDFNVKKDPDKKRFFSLEAQITLEDGTVEEYIDSGRNETALIQRFQAKLAEFGTRKSDLEGSSLMAAYDSLVPVGEIRDVITPHDFLDTR